MQTDGHSTAIGTASGTVLTLAVNLTSQDLTKTAVLAAVGAFVSFTVSLVLKWAWKRIKR